MGKRLPMQEVRARELLQRGARGISTMYQLQLYGIAHSQHAFPYGEVRSGQGILHRLFRRHQQEGHQLDRAEPQIRPAAEDLLVLQAQSDEGDEKLGEPPDNGHGRSGRDRVRGTGGGRAGQKEQ